MSFPGTSTKVVLNDDGTVMGVGDQTALVVKIYQWNVSDWSYATEIPVPNAYLMARFSADGNRLMLTHSTLGVQVWRNFA